MAGSTTTLDRPDSAVRSIMQKRADGLALSDRERKRLAARMSAEAETQRTGGTVQQGITPRRVSPYEMGQQDRAADDEYAAGYEKRAAPGQPAPDSAVRRAPPAAAPMASREASADAILRRRFGPPPNERGQMDIADAGGTRSVPSPLLPRTPITPKPVVAATPAPAATPAAPVQRRTFGAPQRLANPVAPAVGAGANGSYVGGGGNYMADFATKRSAQDFAEFAARASTPGPVIADDTSSPKRKSVSRSAPIKPRTLY
jgi:hypothetical protein